MDAGARKQVLRSLVYGLYAIGTVDEHGEPVFLLASWLMQVSVEPTLIVVALEREGVAPATVRARGAFAVSLLPSGASRLAARIGRPTAEAPHKLRDITHRPATITASPILDDALAWMDCRIVAEYEAGDHALVTAEVVDARAERPGTPLTLGETGWWYGG